MFLYLKKIKELNLDNSKAAAINGLTSEFVELETLSLKSMGLTSLKGFPALPKLRSLELNDNCISDGLDSLLVCPNLTHLNLSGNKLDQLDALKPLNQLAHLTHLKLHNGEIEMKEDYRDEVFKLLGNNLKYLDGFDVNEQEEDDEDYSDESDEDEDDDDDEEEEEGEEKSEPIGLSYLQKSNLAEEESDDEDFDVEKAEKKEQDEAMDTEMLEEKQPAAAATAAKAEEEEVEEDEDESESDGEPGVSYLLKRYILKIFSLLKIRFDRIKFIKFYIKLIKIKISSSLN
jgi:acidic leucine-rich nuclear phosphoprotein 32 family protein A/C/D